MTSFSPIRSSLLLLVALLLATGLGSALAVDDRPVSIDKEESIDVRVVQVDVSVLPPGAKTYASVPGLTLDHFDLRLDGHRLSAEQRAKVKFDALCEKLDPADQTPPPPIPIIAVVDFNYVDARGRFRVAEAIDEIAEKAAEGPEIYKIYGLTQQVRLLTDGFTKDPEALHQAAEVVRGTSFRGGEFVAPGTDDVPEVKKVTLQDLAEAFGPSPINIFPDEQSAAEAEIVMNTLYFEAQRTINPEASMAALEAILRAHSNMPGSKAVILFSSESFRMLRVERFDQAVEGLRELAKLGFRVWTVDVEGLSRRESGASELLSLLAQDTGGQSIRRTGRLTQAFEGAAEQLSCHYLLSLPVPSSTRYTQKHTLVVKIDSDKYPEMWKYRVIAPSQITLPSLAAVRRNRRIAALLSPEDFNDPEVVTTLAYPLEIGERSVLPVRVRAALRDLTWLPDSRGGVRARVLVDAVVLRDTGRSAQPVCELGAEKTGPIEIRLKRRPAADSTAGIAIQLPCLFEKDGLYTARGVITDMETDLSGAGQSAAMIRRKGEKEWKIYAPRVQAASGRDFLWQPGAKTIQRDKARMVARQVNAHDPATVADRIFLRYLLCGPDASQAGVRMRHFLLRLVEGQAPQVIQAFSPETLHLATTGAEGPFCAPGLLAVAEYSLEPGNYAFAVLDATADPALASQIPADPDQDLPEGVLARVGFQVLP